MGFSKKIKYYLVHTLKYDNRAAQQLISSGRVRLNVAVITENKPLTEKDEIFIDGVCVKKATRFRY
jgi:hypothetical protein